MRPEVPGDPARPLRVVSVSRGSSKRDATLEMELLGRHVRLERQGTDGDLREAARRYAELKDDVDAFGLGGADLELRIAGRVYRIRESVALARHAGRTPVVCGAGLKQTLERRAVDALDASFAWSGKRVLLPSAADRWGMAEALARHGAALTIGDLAFLLGMPIALHDLARFERLARWIAPLTVRLPLAWLYPTGERQDSSVAGWRAAWFEHADVVAGDYHLIARYAPDDLSGTVVLTNTTTERNLTELAARGVAAVATTTPRISGRSLPTNLLEAAFVAIAGRHPLSAADLEVLVEEAGLTPDVRRFGEEAGSDDPLRPRPAAPA